jgi:hypothetical protein
MPSVGVVTVTVVPLIAVPSAPVQVNKYVVVTEGDTCTLPAVPVGVKLVPVQLVALVEDQVSVDELPWTMLVGLADSGTLCGGVGLGTTLIIPGGGGGGGGAPPTVTVTLLFTVPPSPSQESVYVVVTVGATTTEPETQRPNFQGAVQCFANSPSNARVDC